jgi:hypothetical protein
MFPTFLFRFFNYLDSKNPNDDFDEADWYRSTFQPDLICIILWERKQRTQSYYCLVLLWHTQSLLHAFHSGDSFFNATIEKTVISSVRRDIFSGPRNF